MAQLARQGFTDANRIARRSAVHARNVAKSAHLRYATAYGLSKMFPPFALAGGIARLYRAAGFDIGQGTGFGGPVRLVSGSPGFSDNLVIGSNVLISTDVTINIDDVVRIEDWATLGPFVRIYTATHSIGPGSRRMLPQVVGKAVTIERGAWVGLGATILPGVCIGHGSIVGAGSIVTTDVPSNTYVEGNPAKVVRKLPWGDR